MYEVRVMPDAHRVILIFKDDFSHDRAAVHRDVRDAIVRAKSGGEIFDILVDMTGVPVIAQDRAESGEQLMSWCVANGLRNGAIAVNQVLQEMQLKRLSERNEKFSYFGSLADAEAWLDSRIQPA